MLDATYMQMDVKTQVLNSSLARLSSEDALSHAVCGLAEEAGEVAGLLKREVYKRQPQPIDRWKEELGDVLWYLCETANQKGLTIEEIFEYNRAKLKVRYGDWEAKKDELG